MWLLRRFAIKLDADLTESRRLGLTAWNHLLCISTHKTLQTVNFSLTVENETRCYGEIGCLNITREWYHLIHRPFNVFPLPRNVINTKFILYTEDNPNEGQSLVAEDKDSILNSNFRPDRQIKFIIHGFIDTPLSNWVSEMKNELLTYSKQNQIGMSVVIVDWAGGSLPLYTQATANTRLVGLELAYLIKKLRDDHGLRPEDVHLIGHSLGAHLSAYAAERVPKIGRITALDPAEPYFQGRQHFDLINAICSTKTLCFYRYAVSSSIGSVRCSGKMIDWSMVSGLTV